MVREGSVDRNRDNGERAEQGEAKGGGGEENTVNSGMSAKMPEKLEGRESGGMRREEEGWGGTSWGKKVGSEAPTHSMFHRCCSELAFSHRPLLFSHFAESSPAPSKSRVGKCWDRTWHHLRRRVEARRREEKRRDDSPPPPLPRRPVIKAAAECDGGLQRWMPVK